MSPITRKSTRIFVTYLASVSMEICTQVTTDCANCLWSHPLESCGTFVALASCHYFHFLLLLSFCATAFHFPFCLPMPTKNFQPVLLFYFVRSHSLSILPSSSPFPSADATPALVFGIFRSVSTLLSLLNHCLCFSFHLLPLFPLGAVTFTLGRYFHFHSSHHLPRLLQSLGCQCRALGSILTLRLAMLRWWASSASRVIVIMYWPL